MPLLAGARHQQEKIPLLYLRAFGRPWAACKCFTCGVLCAVKAVTWLILPVVICLSQRLSHACLSINCLYGETANGSLNQLEFI